MDFVPFPDAVGVTPVTPSANIKMYAGVPWDYNYTHVRKYKNRTELDNFLSTLSKFESEEVSFVNLGTMNVAIDYNQALSYNCNYMRFVNAPWDNRPHYAFIKSITPVSTSVTQINFELDVWNECQFDMELKECFVEREIVKKSSDVRGAYTYPEDLQLGDYVANGDTSATIPSGEERSDRAFCIASAIDAQGETATFQTYQGVASGLYYGVYASAGDLQGYLDTVLDKKGTLDDIVDAWSMPAVFADKETLVKRTYTINKTSVTNLNGYTPKNNKLFAFPYSYLHLTNNAGQTKKLEFERFKDPTDSDKCELSYTVNLSPSPTLYCYPRNYKGVVENYGDSITFNGYPKLAFAVDAYRAWLAQNSNNLIVSAATGNNQPVSTSDWIGRGIVTALDFIGSITNVGSGSAMTNGVNYVTGMVSGSYSSELQSEGIKGTLSNTLPTAADFDCISVYPVSITAEVARIIDEFFSLYGYKICRVKKPDIAGRSTWNYVKTQNCCIDGKFPTDMLEKMRKIFDNGVTVWHTDDIGNYSLANN